MSSATAQAQASGVSFSSLLCLLFVGLKLGGVIDWSWWWVLSPIWAPLALVLAFVVICLVILGVAALIDTK